MKRAENPNYRTLQWILSFLNQDLDSLSPLDFSHLTLDARYHFVNQWSMLPWVGIPEIEDEARRKDAEEGFTFSSAWPDDYPWEETLVKAQKELRRIVETILKDLAKKNSDPSPTWREIGETKLSFGINGQGTFIAYQVIDKREPYYEPPIFLRLAEMTLYRILVGMPGYTIGECKECGGFFVRLKDKPKYFCSVKCLKALNDRERRMQDPEGYRSKQREIMRKRRAKEKAKRKGENA